MTVYTWKTTDLLLVLSKEGGFRLENVYIWKYLKVLATWHNRIDKGTITKEITR